MFVALLPSAGTRGRVSSMFAFPLRRTAISAGRRVLQRQMRVQDPRAGARKVAQCEEVTCDALAAQRVCTLVHHGFVRLPGMIAVEETQELHALLWKEYARLHGIRHKDLESWSAGRKQDLRLYGPPPLRLAQSAAFKTLQHRLCEVAASMFGPLGSRLRGKATLFVDCPSLGGHWCVPFGWHTDVQVIPADPWPRFVYMFVFLDDVGPCGGSTMLLSGSTRRMHLMSEAVPVGGHNFKEMLAQEDVWFSELFGLGGHQGESHATCEETSTLRTRRLMKKEVLSAGVPLRIEELTGRRGDLLLWDPRALHSASVNASSRPRSVLKFRLEVGYWRQRQIEASRQPRDCGSDTKLCSGRSHGGEKLRQRDVI